jgi:hypothetical protein
VTGWNAQQYIAKSLDNVSELSPDAPWRNEEVEEMLRDIMAEIVKPEIWPIGTAFLDPSTGRIYRFRGLGWDFNLPDGGEEPSVENWGVLNHPDGMSVYRGTLPEGCREIWRPSDAQ